MIKKIIGAMYNRTKAYLLLFKNIRGIKANILDASMTVDELINKKKSLIRLGDGEFAFLYNRGISYQKFEPRIKEGILELITSYNDNLNYLLCVPKYYFECPTYKLIKKFDTVMAWTKPRVLFKKYFNLNNTYGDAFVFGKENKNIYDKFFKSLSPYNVIFVHYDEKYAKIFEERYNKKVDYVKIPSKDSFSVVDNIFEKVEKIVGSDKLKFIVLISAGPMAKILAKRLSDAEIWTVDTGHCWDAPLHIGGV